MTQDSAENFWDILIERCKILFAIVAMLAADAIFLVVWVAIHWALRKGLDWFHPVGYERVAAIVLKIVLEIPMSIAILAYVISDSIRIVRRIFHGIVNETRHESELTNEHKQKRLRDNKSEREIAD